LQQIYKKKGTGKME